MKIHIPVIYIRIGDQINIWGTVWKTVKKLEDWNDKIIVTFADDTEIELCKRKAIVGTKHNG